MCVGMNFLTWKLPFTDGHSAVLSALSPGSRHCLVGVWMFMGDTSSSQMPALFPAYHSAVFGELEAVPWLHSSIPKAQLLSGCRPERLLESTLEITGLKGNGVLLVLCFFIMGYFCRAELRNRRA